MKKTNLKLRVALILIITILGLYKVLMPPITGATARLPKRQDFTLTGIKQNLRENIRLGLDLRGGFPSGHARQDRRVLKASY